jgi:hypothetical protein
MHSAIGSWRWKETQLSFSVAVRQIYSFKREPHLVKHWADGRMNWYLYQTPQLA